MTSSASSTTTSSASFLAFSFFAECSFFYDSFLGVSTFSFLTDSFAAGYFLVVEALAGDFDFSGESCFSGDRGALVSAAFPTDFFADALRAVAGFDTGTEAITSRMSKAGTASSSPPLGELAGDLGVNFSSSII